MRSLMLTLLLFSVSCENPAIELIDYGLEDIERGQQVFYSEFGLEQKTLITFSDEEYKGTVARCYQYGNKVEIVLAIWRHLQPRVREAVVFHELVHCELGLGHFGDNVMNDFMGITADGYINRYEESVNEIRTKLEAR